jgi:hypothetical protein
MKKPIATDKHGVGSLLRDCSKRGVDLLAVCGIE